MPNVSIQELLMLIGDREAQIYALRRRVEELEKQLDAQRESDRHPAPDPQA